jgi:hypothetical protein
MGSLGRVPGIIPGLFRRSLSLQFISVSLARIEEIEDVLQERIFSVWRLKSS